MRASGHSPQICNALLPENLSLLYDTRMMMTRRVSPGKRVQTSPVVSASSSKKEGNVCRMAMRCSCRWHTLGRRPQVCCGLSHHCRPTR